MDGGREGSPSRRGRSEDQPRRSSSEIFTLRVRGSSDMPHILAYRADAHLLPVVCELYYGLTAPARTRRASFARDVLSSSTLRRRTDSGVTSRHSSSRRNSSAWSSES